MIKNYLKAPLGKLFIFECFIIPVIFSIFHFISHRPTAALCASLVFLIFSIFALSIFWREEKTRALGFSWPKITFALALIFLFVFVIPIISVRLAYWGLPATQVPLLSVLHGVSSWFYVAIMVGTFLSLRGKK